MTQLQRIRLDAARQYNNFLRCDACYCDIIDDHGRAVTPIYYAETEGDVVYCPNCKILSTIIFKQVQSRLINNS